MQQFALRVVDNRVIDSRHLQYVATSAGCYFDPDSKEFRGSFFPLMQLYGMLCLMKIATSQIYVVDVN